MSDDVKRFKKILPAQMEAFEQAAKLGEQQGGQEIEIVAKALWERRKHGLLAMAGHPTDWDSQPQSIKNGERRDARAALKALNTQANHVGRDKLITRIEVYLAIREDEIKAMQVEPDIAAPLLEIDQELLTEALQHLKDSK